MAINRCTICQCMWVLCVIGTQKYDPINPILFWVRWGTVCLCYLSHGFTWRTIRRRPKTLPRAVLKQCFSQGWIFFFDSQSIMIWTPESYLWTLTFAQICVQTLVFFCQNNRLQRLLLFLRWNFGSVFSSRSSQNLRFSTLFTQKMRVWRSYC